MTTPWHACADLTARYADGSLPDADAWSLEKHLETCTDCATRVSAAVRATAAGVDLLEIRDLVLTATTTRPEGARGPDMCGSAAWARATPTGPQRPPRLHPTLWSLGPALRGTWLLALLSVTLGALLLDHGAGYAPTRTLLLTIAPVIPLIGVALSYGPHADPLHEITAATPSGGLRLALTRTAAVLGVSLPALTLTGAALPASGAPGAAAWLLPGLALTLGALTLASYVGCRTATTAVAAGWLTAVLVPALAAHGGPLTARLADRLATCFDGTQPGWAAAGAVCAALLAARRRAYDHLENR
ncbi:MAG: zf-HC2 domain-containing protein [Streptomyces sp.]|uniref:zf-HC2 domain-containing protein n=1 Tax=Streptomyces sp. TaxID=1931 RepID=UPI0025D6EBB5|nr:zf-HC2 domain-containing protein [Streptomyces sp.]MBW8794064.1 zf-HC2 domain-containing protein [Streptomyces sp.]